jgi:transcriptional regulator with XRE-family HTH domain
MTDIGKNIKNIRELKNLTQAHVASQLNIAQRTYGNIEKAKNNVTYEAIEQIAKVLEVSVNKILELNAEVILNNNSQAGGQLNQLSGGQFTGQKIIYNGITESEVLETLKNQNIELSNQNKMLLEILAKLKT